MNEKPEPALLMVIAIILAAPITAQALQLRYPAAFAASNVTLAIDFSNGTISTFSGLYGTTVLNVTESVVEIGAYWAGDLAFIISIDGVSQDEDHWWQYWVNGEYASVAASLYNLQDGDHVLWNLTTFDVQSSTTDLDNTLIIGGILLGAGGLGFLLVLNARISRREAIR